MSSCERYAKIQKSNDLDLKMTKAKEYYNKGNYFRAIPLFEDLMRHQKGKVELEDITYFHAYSHYGQKEYLLASFYFKEFFNKYPKSEFAEDALFRAAYCHFLMSPKSNLEQESTVRAIDEFQLFINAFPESEKVAESNDLIDELRMKMESKTFKSAELYYHMREYRAAAVAFKNLLIKYPDSPRRERILFLIFKSNFLYAENSITSKQLERYQMASDSYIEFIDQYKDSKFIKEGEKIYQETIKKIDKINTYGEL